MSDAKRFVEEVFNLAKKYQLPFFVVTDGASGVSDFGKCSAITHARTSHVTWERENGIDDESNI